MRRIFVFCALFSALSSSGSKKEVLDKFQEFASAKNFERQTIFETFNNFDIIDIMSASQDLEKTKSRPDIIAILGQVISKHNQETMKSTEEYLLNQFQNTNSRKLRLEILSDTSTTYEILKSVLLSVKRRSIPNQKEVELFLNKILSEKLELEKALAILVKPKMEEIVEKLDNLDGWGSPEYIKNLVEKFIAKQKLEDSNPKLLQTIDDVSKTIINQTDLDFFGQCSVENLELARNYLNKSLQTLNLQTNEKLYAVLNVVTTILAQLKAKIDSVNSQLAQLKTEYEKITERKFKTIDFEKISPIIDQISKIISKLSPADQQKFHSKLTFYKEKFNEIQYQIEMTFNDQKSCCELMNEDLKITIETIQNNIGELERKIKALNHFYNQEFNNFPTEEEITKEANFQKHKSKELVKRVIELISEINRPIEKCKQMLLESNEALEELRKIATEYFHPKLELQFKQIASEYGEKFAFYSQKIKEIEQILNSKIDTLQTSFQGPTFEDGTTPSPQGQTDSFNQTPNNFDQEQAKRAQKIVQEQRRQEQQFVNRQFKLQNFLALLEKEIDKKAQQSIKKLNLELEKKAAQERARKKAKTNGDFYRNQERELA